MAARKYRASGRREPGALWRIALASLAGAVLTGLLESFVGQWLNLLILYPCVIGGVAGGIAASLIEKRRVRAPMLVAAIALLAGGAGQLAVHAGDYHRFRGELRSNLKEKYGEQAIDPDVLVDALLGKAGHGSFLGYLDLAAEQGITISHHGSKGASITGVGTWILWAIDLLIAAFLAAWLAFEQARSPFCERCERWYDRELIIASGSGEKPLWKESVKALDDGRWEGFLQELGVPGPKARSSVTLNRCSTCKDHEPLLTFKVHTKLNTNKPQATTRYVTLLTADETRRLEKVLAAQAERQRGAEPATSAAS